MPRFFLLTLFFAIVTVYADAQSTVFEDTRDGQNYPVVHLNNLKWLGENLRYRSPSQNDTLIDVRECGVFYSYADAANACPPDWRLPNEKEVKALIKLNKRKKINLTDTLQINLCGRIDYEKYRKRGIQNTFWLDA